MRRPAFRRRLSRRTRGRRLTNRVYSFRRTANLGQLTAFQDGNITSIGIQAGYSFQLDQVPQFTEFTQLYDQYKLSMVKLELRPTVTDMVGVPNQGFTAASGFYPLRTVIDYDDAQAPPNEPFMFQYQNMRTTQPTRVHTRVVRPKFSTRAYATALSDGFRPSTGFIDCNQPSVPHYGLKVWMDPPPLVASTRSTLTYNVYATYYLKFKNVR